MGRPAGITTRQMRKAPTGAVFVWCTDDLFYPKKLARELGREDLDVRPLGWLKVQNVCTRQLPAVIVDHYAVGKLGNEARYALDYLHRRSVLVVC